MPSVASNSVDFAVPTAAPVMKAEMLPPALKDGDKFVVYYWGACGNFWGRAFGPVLALNWAQTKNSSLNFEIKSPDDAAGASASGFAWPRLRLPSGVIIAQTSAILDAIAEYFDLGGATFDERMLCKRYVADFIDISAEALKGDMSPERAAKWLSLLDTALDNKTYFLGDSKTIADAHGFSALSWFHGKVMKPAEYAKDYPNLASWWTTMTEDASVKEMLAKTPVAPF